MYTAIIIDDELDAINALSKLLGKFSQHKISVVGSASNLLDGVGLINKYNPDIVFIDINMPNSSGLEI